MSLERCSLLDDEKAASMRTDLSLPEMYKTRLLRPDLPPRSRADPISHWIHRLLREYRYWRLSRRSRTGGGVEAQQPQGAPTTSTAVLGRAHSFSHQNSAPIANTLGRLIATATTAFFLVVPLALLSPRSPTNLQLVVVSVCILLFSFIVATIMKASNFEMLAVSSAYAAVLAVFISNTS
jgi:VIT1/CCC1 family predicted Fe2+/Mn2+ transporter